MAGCLERARAKINLTLRVHGRRADGYHLIESLVAFADIGDTVALDVAAPVALTLTGPMGGRIVGANILSRTLDLLATRHPELSLGAVTLDKRLPVASGIGGGSSDAAALLRCVRSANPVVSVAVDWAGLALELGADVPVCLASRPTVMSGVGEILAPLTDLPVLETVLVNPMVEVPATKTRDVFQRLRAAPIEGAPAVSLPPVGGIETKQAIAAGHNDLTAAATSVIPAIADVLAAIAETEGCWAARLSGAGPTCFGLYGDRISAAAAATSLRQRYPGWWVVATAIR